MTPPVVNGSDISSIDDRRVLKEFRAWAEHALPDDASEDDLAEAGALVDLLALVFSIAREGQVDPHDPESIQDFIDALDDSIAEDPRRAEDPEVRDMLLGVLDEYLHFRLDTSEQQDAWDAAHEVLEEELFPEGDPYAVLFEQLAAEETTSDEDRRAALIELPVIAAVPKLLAWIGRGRPAAPSGGARRSDISEVAALLGIAAVGVNRRSSRTFDEAEPGLDVEDVSSEKVPLQVMAMNEVPELTAWWEALTAAGVIAPTPSRLRPGPAAPVWLSDDDVPLESLEAVAGIFLATLLTHEVTSSRSEFFGGWNTLTVQAVLMNLIAALVPEDAEFVPAAPDPFGLLTPRVDIQLEGIARQGFIGLTRDRTIEIPAALRLTVLRAVAAVGSALNLLDEDEDLDDLEDEDLDGLWAHEDFDDLPEDDGSAD
ncbi:MAG TPA: hypothetical protein PKE40_01500 [Arachnia sp.]|nr:hypothetical protein [Arachnia sp.]HMT85003.1 hypothetical protein [Arachnia sp.]